MNTLIVGTKEGEVRTYCDDRRLFQVIPVSDVRGGLMLHVRRRLLTCELIKEHFHDNMRIGQLSRIGYYFIRNLNQT